MHAVYLTCLFGGALATAVFVLLGAIGGAGHGHVGHAGHAHAGHAHAGHAHGSAPHSGHQATAHHGTHASGNVGAAEAQETSPVHVSGVHGVGTLHTFGGWLLGFLSPLTLAAAALWFGAGGLIGEQLAIAAIVVAVVAAILGVMFVRVVTDAFVRASVDPLSLTAEGAIGTVNAAIRARGTGEVIYTLEGLQRSSAARTADGRALPRGASVVIVRRERGVAYVEPLDPLLYDSTPTDLPVGESSQAAADTQSEVSRPR